jgi:hypothetical protein
MMSENFTHYDLHHGNVQLYKVGSDHYVEYHYHLSDGSVTSFKSEYLVKIIDYGRSFFNDDSNPGVFGNSQRIFTELCRYCIKCGEDNGYAWFEEAKNDYFIHSQQSNVSHDLRLLNEVKNTITAQKRKKRMEGTAISDDEELIHFLNLLIYDDDFGTKPIRKTETDYDTDVINNVMDAFEKLNEIILREKFVNYNTTFYETKTKIGEMHIYGDRPLEFQSFHKSPRQIEARNRAIEGLGKSKKRKRKGRWTKGKTKGKKRN